MKISHCFAETFPLIPESVSYVVRPMQPAMTFRLIVTCFVFLCLAAGQPVRAGVKADTCAVNMPYQGPAQAGALDADMFPRTAFNTEPMPEAIADRLQERFTELLPLTEATAGTIAIWHPTIGRWSSRTGEGETPFWWASVAKLFTATIIWQLIESEELDLQDRVDQWLPDYPGAELITVDQLLTHTSGVFSFNADKKLRTRNAYTPPEDLLEIAARHRFDFCPGTDWYYSNTGYVMLGLIAEAVTKQSLAALIGQRIAKPLELGSVRLASPGDPANSFTQGLDDAAPSIEAIATTFGAGAVLGNAGDMVSFLHSILNGGVLSTGSRDDAFSKRYAMFGQMESYGRGVMVIPVPDPEFTTTWIGHSGGAPGAKAVLIYDARRQVYLAAAINRQAAAEAVANNMLKTLDTLLTENP
jgi:D-alanyl-D-alanine carboxypeptidase